MLSELTTRFDVIENPSNTWTKGRKQVTSSNLEIWIQRTSTNPMVLCGTTPCSPGHQFLCEDTFSVLSRPGTILVDQMKRVVASIFVTEQIVDRCELVLATTMKQVEWYCWSHMSITIFPLVHLLPFL